MKKAILSIALTMIAVSLLAVYGCSQEQGPTVAIRFGELWDSDYNVSERIKGLDGERVSMTGFMAVQSPLDGSFIYLTNAPMVSCPYCIPGTNTPVFAVPAIAPPRDPITFTDQPVTISGKLEIEEKVDEFGYTTAFRINVETLKVADISQMPQSLRDYTMLSSEGITADISALIDKAHSITNVEAEVTIDDSAVIEKMEIDEINSLKNRIRGYNNDSFEPLIEILRSLSELSKNLNDLIEAEEYEQLPDFTQETLLLWEEFFDWANNMASID